jgi:choline dehydrogenase-like flavoprotein
MLVTTADLSPETPYDVCVIGAGPAGITVARRLASRGRRVLLLEGGDETAIPESEDVYRGEVVGDHYFELHEARLRVFGGTSGHWSGWVRPLDAWDFEPKADFEKAVWPIRRADLDPYLAEAAEILEFDPVFDDHPVSDEFGVDRVRFLHSPPVRFDYKYFYDIVDHPEIALCLRANVFRLEPDGGRIAAAEVLDYEGGRTTVRAGAFVLACGGIENSRILLHSNALSNGGVVPNAETLGRYWMEHPHFTIGGAIFVDETRALRGNFALSGETQRRLGVLGCGLRMSGLPYSGYKRMVADIACVAPDLSYRLLKLAGSRLVCGARLRAAWEQAPRSENRVELSGEETDRFGVPRPVLHWTKSEADLRSLRETALQFGRWIAAEGRGRVRLEPWVFGEADYPEDDETAGYHHMGGTRMASSPQDGVVNADLRVFGVDNLYVCGSSVFPSSGHANPTLTIVQLALRLGDAIAS